MRYFLLFFLAFGIFVGLGCNNESSNTSSATPSTDDCYRAEIPFACFLDKATAAQDPNLCNDVGEKRVICYSAYAELTETEIDCSIIKDPIFQEECQDYLMREEQLSNQYRETSSQPSVNPPAINN